MTRRGPGAEGARYYVCDAAEADPRGRCVGMAADPVPMDGPWAGLDEQLPVRRGA